MGRICLIIVLFLFGFLGFVCSNLIIDSQANKLLKNFRNSTLTLLNLAWPITIPIILPIIFFKWIESEFAKTRLREGNNVGNKQSEKDECI